MGDYYYTLELQTKWNAAECRPKTCILRQDTCTQRPTTWNSETLCKNTININIELSIQPAAASFVSTLILK